MKRLLAAGFIFAIALASAQTTVTTDPARTGIPTGGGGSGTVTSVSVTTANGVSGSVANSTTTPAISLTLGAITPSTVITGTVTTSVINGTPTIATPTISGHPTIEGVTSTGATGTGSIVYSSSPTINTPTFVAPALGTPSSGTATNLTGTAASLTAGSATVLATPRAIAGHNFDGSAAITIACGDLSNGATGCSTATGTSGATIPLLNAANTWSGAQSFNSSDLILKGATSGTTTLNAAATAGSTTITLPGGTTDFSGTGGTSQVVKQTSSGGAFTVGRLACADLSDSGAGCTGAAGATLGANTFTATQTVTEAVGSSALVLNGATQTVSHPVLSATQTWNAAVTFTGKQTTITATSANIDSVIEKWLGGASGTTLQLAITGLGGTASNGPAIVVPAGVLNSPGLSFGSSNVGTFGAAGLYKGTNVELMFGGSSTAGIGLSNGNGLSVNNGSGYRWSGTLSADTTSWDTGLTRDAAGIVQFNGGAAGTTKGGYKVIDDTAGSSHTSTSSTELTTLATGATTTATSGNLAAANSQIKAILLRVTTTITTAANFTVKVTGGNAFCQIGTATTSNSTLTANTTYVMVPCAHADAYVSAAATLTYTLNANPGAGVIRATVVYETFTPPSS